MALGFCAGTIYALSVYLMITRPRRDITSARLPVISKNEPLNPRLSNNPVPVTQHERHMRKLEAIAPLADFQTFTLGAILADKAVRKPKSKPTTMTLTSDGVDRFWQLEYDKAQKAESRRLARLKVARIAKKGGKS